MLHEIKVILTVIEYLHMFKALHEKILENNFIIVQKKDLIWREKDSESFYAEHKGDVSLSYILQRKIQNVFMIVSWRWSFSHMLHVYTQHIAACTRIPVLFHSVQLACTVPDYPSHNPAMIHPKLNHQAFLPAAELLPHFDDNDVCGAIVQVYTPAKSQSTYSCLCFVGRFFYQRLVEFMSR